MNRVELLSPAGDLERLKVTLLYGADAVYIGGKKYSLRANATNFDIEEIKEGVEFAHKLNKRVHFTLNIAFHEEDLKDLYEYIEEVVNTNIDAFIVSDISAANYIKNKYPNVEVHISTQDSTTNIASVKYLEDKGFDRVVLARELSEKEIKEINDNVNIPTEVFIHGATCSCLSGRCALSNYVTNRDANRGGCAQVCRFTFETDKKDFTFATKDMNMAPHIKELIDIGVKSLKVEGRMRSIYYLATVIGTYHKLIDDIYTNKLTEERLNKYIKTLNRVANRETSSHYFKHEADYTDQYFTGRQELSNQDFLALIDGYDSKNKCLNIIERNYFEVGDKVEIFTPTEEYTITIDKLYDENMNSIDIARHPGELLKIPFKKELPKYSMIRIKERNSYESNRSS